MLQSTFSLVMWVFLLLMGLLFLDTLESQAIGLLRNFISRYSPPIKTWEELQKILKKEQEKLGLLNKNIKAVLIAPRPSFLADVKKMGDGFYLIRCVLNSPRTVIAHELYHIYDGTADAFKKSEEATWAIIITNCLYWIWWEPRAIFYEFRRLRACNLTLK